MTVVPPFAGSLMTPLEPGRSARRGATVDDDSRASCAVYSNELRRLEVVADSWCGSQHAVNEDSHSDLESDGRLFVVADGVGGGAMAQAASRWLVAHLHRALESKTPDAASVAGAVLGADRAIAEAIARVTTYPGAATVVLGAPLDRFAARWLLAWVGDCRAYRWSRATEPHLELLTRDDTFANLGETPPVGGSVDDPARMVGNGATLGANVGTHDLACGDSLVLCSDGVHKHLVATDWASILGSPIGLADRSRQLLAQARANGSVDDATLLLIERQEPVRPPRNRQSSPVAPRRRP